MFDIATMHRVEQSVVLSMTSIVLGDPINDPHMTHPCMDPTFRFSITCPKRPPLTRESSVSPLVVKP